MRIFKTKLFEQFADSHHISDDDLNQAIERANQGLIDAQLGSNLIKQRIARKNAGKSSGYRSIILYQIEHHCFFLYGFAKNQRENISPKDLAYLKMLAKQLASYNEETLDEMVATGYIFEIQGTQNEQISK